MREVPRRGTRPGGGVKAIEIKTSKARFMWCFMGLPHQSVVGADLTLGPASIRGVWPLTRTSV
jgi:hypothetical protein